MFFILQGKRIEDAQEFFEFYKSAFPKIHERGAEEKTQTICVETNGDRQCICLIEIKPSLSMMFLQKRDAALVVSKVGMRKKNERKNSRKNFCLAQGEAEKEKIDQCVFCAVSARHDNKTRG